MRTEGDLAEPLITAGRRAVLAVGHGRYADPWHPYDEVGERMRELLESDDWVVRVETDVDAAMTRLDDADLLVVLAGDPWGQGERSFGAPAASIAGLDRALGHGTGVLALHSAAASLRDYPAWGQAIGGIWIPEASMHPPFEEAALVEVAEHPLTVGIGDFTVADERYSRLQPIGDRVVLAEHTEDGVREPLVWLRRLGAARVAYDGLGHDTRSYDSEPHRELLRRLARWVAGRDLPPGVG